MTVCSTHIIIQGKRGGGGEGSRIIVSNGEMRNVYRILWKSMTCSNLVADISIEWRILMKGILKKEILRMCTGVMWFGDGPL